MQRSEPADVFRIDKTPSTHSLVESATSQDPSNGQDGQAGRLLDQLRRGGIAILVFASTAMLAYLVYLFWPRNVELLVKPSLLVLSIQSQSKQQVSKPGSILVGQIGAYKDGLYAYLMFDYLRSRPALRSSEVLLDYKETAGLPSYSIHVICPDNLLVCVPWLAELEKDRLAQTSEWAFLSDSAVTTIRRQTQFFINAYNGPVGERFQALSSAERVLYVRRFLRFKSTMDRRVRLGNDGLRPLTKDQARELAGDIIAVAEFYKLPLEFFLGIGAMENNYLDAPGDLNHSVWKRRAEKGDIVIRRRRGRVLVRNFSLGVWQITRETLRFAHALYLADKRDYSLLPQRLRPNQTLDIDQVSPVALTTYAGILIRYLLDYFQGDIAKAVGAYNGGVDRPNEHYEAGVRQIAEYARRILGRAAAMKDASVSAIRNPPAPGS